MSAPIHQVRVSLLVLIDGTSVDAARIETEVLAGRGTLVRAWEDVLEDGRRSGLTHSGHGFNADYTGGRGGEEKEKEEEDGLVKPYDDPELPYSLMVSSGSTGAPKGTATTKRNWRKSNCNPGPFGQISDKAERR
jgi:long-subunit acyl-CoA synthetase (AMP-forming)